MSVPTQTHGVEGNRPFNHYRRERCNNFTISKDLHAGVTPFLVRCHATAHCSGMAQSTMYRGPQTPEQAPHITWYAPSPEELDAYLKDLDPMRREQVLDHVNQGGLLMRVSRPPHLKLPWGMRPRQA